MTTLPSPNSDAFRVPTAVAEALAAQVDRHSAAKQRGDWTTCRACDAAIDAAGVKR